MSKRNTLFMYASVALTLSTAACGGGMSWQQKVEDKILNQATFDLSCDRPNLKLVQIEENAISMGHMYTYGVQGCEKKATYKGMCAAMGGCSTTIEGQVQAAPAGSSTPAHSVPVGSAGASASAASPSATPTGD